MRKLFSRAFRSSRKNSTQVPQQSQDCQCHVCCTFATPDNLGSLLGGESLVLCKITEVIERAQAGCPISTYLLTILGKSTGSNQYTEGTDLRAKVKKRNDGIMNVEFTFSDFSSLYNSQSYGGLQQFSLPQQSIDMGLWAYPDDPVFHLIEQAPPDADVGSLKAFEWAKTLISECLNEHENCPRFEHVSNTILPTRLIDVTRQSDLQRVKLVTTAEDQVGQYAALSYCWGENFKFKASKENLVSLQEGFDIRSLPRTIQDAVTCTQQLGLQYLWVDALTIVQDDAADKAKEIQKMASIYKNSTVTLFAASAADANQGFLQMRTAVKDRETASIPLRFLNLQQDEGGEVYQGDPIFGSIFLCPDGSLGLDANAHEEEYGESPIHKRAWVLQESWLSPRALIYGNGPLSWRCLTMSQTQGADPKYYNRESRRFTDGPNRSPFFPRKDGSQQEVTNKELYTEWSDVVNQFSKRFLTYPEDKLHAISGIASEFHRVMEDDYLAGLWRHSLPHSLLWHQVLNSAPSAKYRNPDVEFKDDGEPECQISSTYRAPSWSWANVDGRVALESFIVTPPESKVTVLDCEIAPPGDLSPTGQITIDSAKLTLRGPIRHLTYEEIKERFEIYSFGGAHTFSDHIILDGGMTNKDLLAASIDLNSLGHRARAIRGENIPFWHGVNEPSRAKPIPEFEEEDLDGVDPIWHMKDGRRFWFLEIVRDPRPRGIVMVPRGDGTLERTGYFKMGQEQLNDSGEIDSTRDWDWNAGIKIRQVTIV